jgi:hypothetical protein
LGDEYVSSTEVTRNIWNKMSLSQP